MTVKFRIYFCEVKSINYVTSAEVALRFDEKSAFMPSVRAFGSLRMGFVRVYEEDFDATQCHVRLGQLAQRTSRQALGKK